MRKLTVVILSLLFTMFVSFPVFAFKVDTHIWVGQQVINDLVDGNISIEVGGVQHQFAVSSELRNAILTRQGYYRMGNVGPDAFPDIITGQSVVHPGTDDGWKTDDWLKWIISNAESEEEVAFAYGYLAHAAADVFAHSYVNQYAGDGFDLWDDEQDVEARHVLLEQYISSKTPPLSNYLGQDISQSSDLLQIPSVFIKNSLIMNQVVSDQYNIGPVSHLASVYNLKSKLLDILSEDGVLRQLEVKFVNALIAEAFGMPYIPDEVGETILDVSEKPIDIYNQYNPMVLMNESLQVLGDVQTEVFDALIQISNNHGRDAVIEYHDTVIELFTLKGEVFTTAEKLAAAYDYVGSAPADATKKVFGFVERAICNDSGRSLSVMKQIPSSAVSDQLKIVVTPDMSPIVWYEGVGSPLDNGVEKIFFGDDYTTINSHKSVSGDGVVVSKFSFSPFDAICFGCDDAADATVDAVKNLADELEDLAQRTFSEISQLANDGDFCAVFPEFCLSANLTQSLTCNVTELAYEVIDVIIYPDPTYLSNKLLIDELEELLPTLENRLEDAENVVKNLTTELTNISIDLAIDTMEFTRDGVNVSIAMADRSVFETFNPIRGYFEDWVADVDRVMEEYVEVSGSIIKETLLEDGNPKQPLLDWLDCSAFALVGLPKPILDANCLTKEYMGNITDGLNDLHGLLDLVNPAVILLDDLKSKVEAEIQEEVEALAIAYVENKVGGDIESVIDILELHENQLDFIYETRLGGDVKELLSIPDISNRVASEMSITNGYFDKDSYAVIHNAVVMAKLSLLNGFQLNQLAMTLGATGLSIYSDGNPLYPDDAQVNVLFDSIKSIDGNHQWMHVAPPYPRRATGPDYSSEESRSYGYIFDGSKGFRFWQDPDARQSIFSQIFIGPLSPGIDAPSLIGYSDILPAQYTYKVCDQNPFPLSVYDFRCIGGQSDDDGLDDEWEFENIGNVLQSGVDDPDNDGESNFSEYSIGTDPLH